jgi:hypothetical protein
LLVSIKGPRLPDSTDSEKKEFYAQYVLLLFKPWRDIVADLKPANQTWAEALAEWEAAGYPNSCVDMQRILDNAQVYQYSKKATAEVAEIRRQQAQTGDADDVKDFGIDMTDSEVDSDDDQDSPHGTRLTDVPLIATVTTTAVTMKNWQIWLLTRRCRWAQLWQNWQRKSPQVQ